MCAQRPDYLLDVSDLEPEPETEDRGTLLANRRWIGVRFDCCGVYQRLYKSKDGRRYCGCCPRCLRKVRVQVGSGGTDARFFTAE